MREALICAPLLGVERVAFDDMLSDERAMVLAEEGEGYEDVTVWWEEKER